jgi:hypothetical protein
MLDQSLSMAEPLPGGTRWTQVTQALTSFFQNAAADNFALGLQYFGLPAAASPDTPSGFVDSCNPADYAHPEVEIDTLTDATRKSLKASIDAHWPSSNTPTGPALRGAIDHARSWATEHRGSVTAVVLATDGEPYGCGSSTELTAAIAADGVAGTPPIFTYVIGVGAGLSDLASIAEQGGTRQPILVDDSTDLRAGLSSALEHVRGAEVLPCHFEIPQPSAGDTLDFTRVNVNYTPGSGDQAGQRLTLLQVADEPSCSRAEGWYYDNPGQPTEIRLCPALCDEINAHAHDGSVNVVLGCQSRQAEVN